MPFRPIAFILALLLLGSPFSAFALTFKQCQKLLKHDPDLRSFIVSKPSTLTEDELEILQNIFDRTTPHVEERIFNKKSKHPLHLKNPFSIGAKINPSGQIMSEFTQWNGLVNDEEFKQLKLIFTKLLKKILATSKQHPLLSDAVPKNQLVQARMFGIRYLLTPHQQTESLKFHRDTNSVLQSLVVIKRPEQLTGGNTLVSWPNSPQIRTLGGGYAPRNMVHTVWQPDLEENQLLIFDGYHSFHGTSPFILPKARSNKPVFRDVIGLVITNKED